MVHLTMLKGCDHGTFGLGNAKECAAKSITKQHCALTWLGKLNLVKNRDAYTPTELIKDWNRTATNQSKLQGNKHSAVLALLALDQKAIEFLLGHLNEFGSQGNAFSETVWASKKIMPGGGPRGFPKEWNARLTMTSETFMLLLRYVDAQRRSKLEGARVKVPAATMEEAAQMCALLSAVIGRPGHESPDQPRCP